MNARIPNETRRAVYRRDGYRCALCDCTQYLQIHHAIPRGHGGSDEPENLITLCSKCHAGCHGLDLYNGGWDADDYELAVVEYLSDLYTTDTHVWEPYTENPYD